MGSQLGGEMQVTCLCVHPAGMAPKMGLRHRFPALGRRAGGRVLPRVSAATAACSRLRSLGNALAGRAPQQLQRRLSWRMVKETSDQASFPWRNWKLSRCQANEHKGLTSLTISLCLGDRFLHGIIFPLALVSWHENVYCTH